MVWQVVARKEIRALSRTRRRKAGLGLVAFVFVMGGYLLPISVTSPTTTDFPGYMKRAVVLLVPLFGLLVGYKSIVAERASGQLQLLLSLPHSRRGSVFGKFVGRGFILVIVVTIGITIGSALVAYPFGSFEIGTFLAYVFVTLAYGLAYVSIGMAISTLTRSGRRATTATFGVFFLFVIVWTQLRTPFYLALEYLGVADDRLPDWALFLHGLEPGMCYRRIIDAFFANVESGPYLGADAPVYLGEWAALGLLLVWIVVPVGLGYMRFERTDL